MFYKQLVYLGNGLEGVKVIWTLYAPIYTHLCHSSLEFNQLNQLAMKNIANIQARAIVKDLSKSWNIFLKGTFAAQICASGGTSNNIL